MLSLIHLTLKHITSFGIVCVESWWKNNKHEDSQRTLGRTSEIPQCSKLQRDQDETGNVHIHPVPPPPLKPQNAALGIETLLVKKKVWMFSTVFHASKQHAEWEVRHFTSIYIHWSSSITSSKLICIGKSWKPKQIEKNNRQNIW